MQERIDAEKKREEKSRTRRLELERDLRERKKKNDENRQKLVGEAMLERAMNNPEEKRRLLEMMDAHLTDDKKRVLFDLPPSSTTGANAESKGAAMDTTQSDNRETPDNTAETERRLVEQAPDDTAKTEPSVVKQSPSPATDSQLKYIRELMKKDKDKDKDKATELGIDGNSLDALSKRDASELIEKLKG